MWVTHNVALLDLTILLEEAGDFLLAQTWVDSGDEQVGARVGGLIVVVVVTLALGGLSVASVILASCREWCEESASSPIAAAVGGLVAGTGVDIAVTVNERGARAITRGVFALAIICTRESQWMLKWMVVMQAQALLIDVASCFPSSWW